MFDINSPDIQRRIAIAKDYSDQIKAISSSYETSLMKVWSKYRSQIHTAAGRGEDTTSIVDELIERLYELLEELLTEAITIACRREEMDTAIYVPLMPLSVQYAALDYYRDTVGKYRDILISEIIFANSNGFAGDMNLFLFNPTAYMNDKKNGLLALKEGIAGVSKGVAYAFGDNMKKLGISMAALAYTNSLAEIWKVRGGVAYYFGVRNSNYPCPLCDSYAHVPIPFSQGMIYPLHNRCVCSIVQVYQNEIE